MTYARKLLALLLVFCVVFNLTSAVFAEGEDEPLPEDTVVEEDPVPEETEPPDREAPGDEKPPDETAPEETGRLQIVVDNSGKLR